MALVSIFECLCDPTRLRIMHLLRRGPLCVCHLQDVLGEPQVKISKHLAYLKARGMVSVDREANWRIYRLAENPGRTLRAALGCLEECAAEERAFRQDLEKLARVLGAPDARGPDCCAKPAPRAPRTKRSVRR